MERREGEREEGLSIQNVIMRASISKANHHVRREDGFPALTMMIEVNVGS